jgi:hypothetical protein
VTVTRDGNCFAVWQTCAKNFSASKIKARGSVAVSIRPFSVKIKIVQIYLRLFSPKVSHTDNWRKVIIHLESKFSRRDHLQNKD